MKKFLVFILILASNYNILACGFYPYGEDIRFCFFHPDNFKYNSYSEFNYSSYFFYPHTEKLYRENDILPNDQLWFDYCHGKVDYKAIHDAVYKIPENETSQKSDNDMIQFLYSIKDFEAIDYLKFAKKCENFNTYYDDPWERNEYITVPKRTKLLDKAIVLSKTIKNEDLKTRYTFLAIRMAFYNQDNDEIRNLYDSVFTSKTKNNIIKYWSLYFRTFAEINKPLASFYAAQVFANAPDKRFMIHGQFDENIPIESILKYAKTKREIANIYLMASALKSDKSLNYIKQVYKNNPNSDGLGFLILREINKIEDWVFTPYYSLFSPSTESGYWNEKEKSISSILNRVTKDRVYANDILQFINKIDLQKTDNPIFWRTAKAHLFFITKNYESSLSEIHQLEKIVPKTDSIYNQIEIIKALNLTANQTKGKAIIPEEVKDIILKNKKDKKFIFALGRELEYNGNTTDAVFLYSKLDDNEDSYNTVFWKTHKNRKGSYQDYYQDYFSYIDIYYTPKQIKALIDAIKIIVPSDPFSIWKYSSMKNQSSKLYDLLGTMYIRKNDLKKALISFNKSDKSYWNDNYTNWKKDYNQSIFDQNPFFTLKYTNDFIKEKENFILNKTTVTRKLLLYLSKANDIKEKDRDYYYFLVANCYHNMTIDGNSWMMRRFKVSSYDVEPFPEDEKEFQHSLLAKKYYLLAYKNAKNDKFKALCLRLAKDYKKLKNKYPDDYEQLADDCTFFEDYFKARR